MALLTLVARPARAEEVLRVGIVVTVAVNVSEKQADRLGRVLGEVLSEKFVLDVVAGAQVRRRLPSGGLPDDCSAQPACIADVGRRLEAQQLLLLVVVGIGDRVQIDPTWVDVKSGRAVARAAIQIEDTAQAAAVFSSFAAKLVPDAVVRAKPASESNLISERPTVSSPPIDAHPDDAGKRMTTGTWIAGGLSLGALAAGIGLGLSARSDYRELEAGGCDRVMCDEGKIDGVDLKSKLADGMFVASAAAGATAIILYLRSAPVRPNVAVSSTGIFVTVKGRF